MVIGLLAFLVVLAAAGVKFAARLLVISDPLEPARAIDVLNGSLPYRAEEAAKIYHQGLAPEIWVARLRQWPGMDALGVQYTGEEIYNKEVLLKFGVPEAAIHFLPVARNTEEEELAALRELKRVGGTKIILVTSLYHTRRVGVIWHYLAGNSTRAIVRGAPEEPFDPNHWLRNADGAKDVVHEYLGLCNAWAGFPLQPALGD